MPYKWNANDDKMSLKETKSKLSEMLNGKKMTPGQYAYTLQFVKRLVSSSSPPLQKSQIKRFLEKKKRVSKKTIYQALISKIMKKLKVSMKEVNNTSLMTDVSKSASKILAKMKQEQKLNPTRTVYKIEGIPIVVKNAKGKPKQMMYKFVLNPKTLKVDMKE